MLSVFSTPTILWTISPFLNTIRVGSDETLNRVPRDGKRSTSILKTWIFSCSISLTFFNSFWSSSHGPQYVAWKFTRIGCWSCALRSSSKFLNFFVEAVVCDDGSDDNREPSASGLTRTLDVQHLRKTEYGENALTKVSLIPGLSRIRLTIKPRSDARVRISIYGSVFVLHF